MSPAAWCAICQSVNSLRLVGDHFECRDPDRCRARAEYRAMLDAEVDEFALGELDLLN